MLSNCITPGAMLKGATLCAAACALLLATGCKGTRSSSPPIHPQLNMDFQWRLDPQEGSEFFTDKRGMRPQVAGTVAHGALEATDGATEHLYDGRINGEWTDQLPQGKTLDAPMLARGQERFAIFCTPCHGGTGMGDGIIVQRGYVAPQKFTDPRLRAYPLGRFVHVLRHGQGNMPSYAAQIPVDDRWAIAAYLRALQISQAAPNSLAKQGGN